MVMLDDATFRARLATLLSRIGISQRGLSAAFGRDPGYVQALLDPTRPSRARPTPDDLARAADATGMTFVELLEALWGIVPDRLADELAALGVGSSTGWRLDTLTAAERREVADYVAFLATRRSAQVRTLRRAGSVRPRTSRERD
jgi:hypothetical protein